MYDTVSLDKNCNSYHFKVLANQAVEVIFVTCVQLKKKKKKRMFENDDSTEKRVSNPPVSLGPAKKFHIAPGTLSVQFKMLWINSFFFLKRASFSLFFLPKNTLCLSMT